MTCKTDILIIGGGAIGLCCAHYLNGSGRQVTLVEKTAPGSGASQGNAGLIIPGQSIPLAAPGVITKGLKWMFDPESPFYIRPRLDPQFLIWLWKFSRHCTRGHLNQAVPILSRLQQTSMTLYQELADSQSIDMGFRQRGVLDAYRSHTEFKKGVQTARWLRQVGLENEILSADDVQNLLSGLRSNIAGAVFYTHDGHLIPDRLVRSLASHAEQNGTVIHTDTEVIAIRRSGRRITAVQTTRGDFQVNEVVLAGGAWSPMIAKDLELKLFVEPAKGYSITYRRPDTFPEIPIVLVEDKVAVTPMDTSLRFAGTLELAGWDDSINRRRVNAILKSISRYLPEIDTAALELVEIWRGPRPCTPDGLPHIGRPKSLDNLIVATGHGMKGISLAPVTGKLVSQLAVHQRPDIDLSALRIERFA